MGKFMSFGKTAYSILDKLPRSSNLYIWYDFTDGSGTSVTDRSGNNRTGTITNGTWESFGTTGFGSGLKTGGYFLHGSAANRMYVNYTGAALTRPYTMIAGIRPDYSSNGTYIFYTASGYILYIPGATYEVRVYAATPYTLTGFSSYADTKDPILCGCICDASAGKLILPGGYLYGVGAALGYDLPAGTHSLGASLTYGFEEGGIFFFAIWNVALTQAEVDEVIHWAGAMK